MRTMTDEEMIAALKAPTEVVEDVKILRDDTPCALADKVNAALKDAVAQTELKTKDSFYSIRGMSGKKYRYFINTLIRSLSDARYLEIGSWMGSTLCSAIHGNKVKAVAIDNWSLFDGPKDDFMENLKRYWTPQVDVSILEADFRAVDYSKMEQSFNVYLFDGPHKRGDHYDGLAMVLPCLDKQFIFIVDDWNWQPVQDGTFQAIEECGLKARYGASVKTSRNGRQPDFNIGMASNWHNGYFIAVLEKPD
jgi:hypothetical protein